MIFSSFQLPVTDPINNIQAHSLQTAPPLQNNRQKIVWSQDGIAKYNEMVQPALQSIRLSWYHPDSHNSLSILLELKNFVLNKAASLTNKTVSLARNPNCPNRPKSKVIKTAKRKVSVAFN